MKYILPFDFSSAVSLTVILVVWIMGNTGEETVFMLDIIFGCHILDES